MKKILIVKTSAIGDVLQTLPLLDYLKQRFPDVSIDWAVEEVSAPLVSAHPFVNKTLVIATKRWRKNLFSKKTREEFSFFRKSLGKYDLVIDCQGNCKSALFTFLSSATVKLGFSLDSVSEWPNIFVTNKRFSVSKQLPVRLRYLNLLQQYFKDDKPFIPSGVQLNTVEVKQVDTPFIMVCFGSNWENKQLKEETLLLFLKKIAKLPLVFIWSSEKEKMVAERMAASFKDGKAVGGLTLIDWYSLMKSASEVVSMDSASLHLAEIAGVRSFSFFGPSSGEMYRPLDGKKHRIFQGLCPYGITFSTRCPRLRTCPTGACLKDLNVDLLVRAYQQNF